MVVAALLVCTLIASAGVGLTEPSPAPPPPPSNPTDQQLDQSKRDLTGKAGEAAAVSTRLTKVQAEADELGAQLESRREAANKALVDQRAAQAQAEEANQRAQATRAETDAAAAAIEQAHRRLDEFITAAYLRGADSGSLSLLTEATDLVERAELTEAIAADQRAALDSLQQARVAKVNVDSIARAAQADAQAKHHAAEVAKRVADGAVANARLQMRAGLTKLAGVEAQRVALEHQLDVLTAQDATLRASRQRYLDYQAQRAAEAVAEQRAAAARLTAGTATRRPGAGSGMAARVIDRALSALGVTYAWGGGNAEGPTLGVRDGGEADANGDFRKTGFDCSGLMIYAFGAAGIGLPHYSGYQYNAGKKVPVSEMRPGDMLFWGNPGNVHHVALYIGNGKMVEAPYSGGKVRVTPVRYGGELMPYVTRLL